MALRSRDPNKRVTCVESRQEEKQLLRLLEECRQIPKNDRLQLRQGLKKGCPLLIDLFRRNKKNSSIISVKPDLTCLQIGLRKYLNKLKQDKEQQLIRHVQEELSKSVQRPKSMEKRPKSQPKPKYVIPIQDLKKPRWWKNILSRSASREKIVNRSHLTSPNWEDQKRTTNFNILKSPISQTISQNVSPKQEDFCTVSPTPSAFNFRADLYSSYSPTDLTTTSRFQHSLPSNEDLFTDPRMLQECRGYLSKMKHPNSTANTIQTVASQVSLNTLPFNLVNETAKFGRTVESYIQNSQSSTTLPSTLFPYFKGRDAEDIISWFFIDGPLITADEFKKKLKQFKDLNQITEQATTYDITAGKPILHVNTFAQWVDQHCFKSLTLTDVRNLFQRLDVANTGRLPPTLFGDPKWLTLFQKADSQNKGYITYWDMFVLRRSWQYVSFTLWYRQSPKTF